MLPKIGQYLRIVA